MRGNPEQNIVNENCFIYIKDNWLQVVGKTQCVRVE